MGFLLVNKPPIIHTSLSLMSFTWCLETQERWSTSMRGQRSMNDTQRVKQGEESIHLTNYYFRRIGRSELSWKLTSFKVINRGSRSSQVSHFRGSLCPICWEPEDDSLRNHNNKSCGGPTHINRTTRTDYQASMGKENQSMSRQRSCFDNYYNRKKGSMCMIYELQM